MAPLMNLGVPVQYTKNSIWNLPRTSGLCRQPFEGKSSYASRAGDAPAGPLNLFATHFVELEDQPSRTNEQQGLL